MSKWGPLPADLVVSNADLAYTYARLIEPRHRKVWTQPKIDRLGHTMGCYLLFLGVRKTFPKLKHHTLILSERYRELIRDIFQRKILPGGFSPRGTVRGTLRGKNVAGCGLLRGTSGDPAAQGLL